LIRRAPPLQRSCVLPLTEAMQVQRTLTTTSDVNS
jgi:hypothetical protein